LKGSAGAGRGGEDGVGDEAEQGGRQVVAHALDDPELRPGNLGGGVPAALGGQEGIVRSMQDDGGGGDPGQARRPVAGGADGTHLAP
jgi:hypothetical protein